MPFSNVDFAKIMAMLAIGFNDASPSKETVALYHRLLNDLPLEVVQLAAERALLEGQYPRIPPVGVLRRLASEFLHGPRLTAGEAYEMARNAVRRSAGLGESDVLRKLPDEVAASLRQIGVQAWRESENPESLRARFIEFYEAMDRKEAARRMLPDRMRRHLTSARMEIERAVANIGRDVE